MVRPKSDRLVVRGPGDFPCLRGRHAYLGIIGQSSCGCFGKLSPSPWVAFGVDVVVLGFLFFAKPDLTALRENPRQEIVEALIPLATMAVGVAAFMSVFLLICHTTYGSVPAAIAHLRGERVSVTPAVVDVGEGIAGETKTAKVEITNWTDEPIRIFGGTSDCSCTVLGDLPLTVAPKESQMMHVQVRLPEKAGFFSRSAAIQIEANGCRISVFRLTGRVR